MVLTPELMPLVMVSCATAAGATEAEKMSSARLEISSARKAQQDAAGGKDRLPGILRSGRNVQMELCIASLW
jgi:hypothetical protein